MGTQLTFLVIVSYNEAGDILVLQYLFDDSLGERMFLVQNEEHHWRGREHVQLRELLLEVEPREVDGQALRPRELVGRLDELVSSGGRKDCAVTKGVRLLPIPPMKDPMPLSRPDCLSCCEMRRYLSLVGTDSTRFLRE